MKITRNLLDDLYTDDQGSQDLTGLRQPRKMRRETKEKPRKERCATPGRTVPCRSYARLAGGFAAPNAPLPQGQRAGLPRTNL